MSPCGDIRWMLVRFDPFQGRIHQIDGFRALPTAINSVPGGDQQALDFCLNDLAFSASGRLGNT